MRCIIAHVARVIVLLCCVVIMAQAWSLYDATGRAGYTKHHDPERAEQTRSAEGDGLADLFEEETGAEPIETIPNEFQFGLAPSAYPWAILDKHHASLLSTAGPAALIALITLGSWFLPTKRTGEETADDA